MDYSVALPKLWFISSLSPNIMLVKQVGDWITKYSINRIISIKNPTFTNHSSILTYADDTSNGEFQEEVMVK